MSFFTQHTNLLSLFIYPEVQLQTDTTIYIIIIIIIIIISGSAAQRGL
jgi:hypothetical protein